MKISINDSKLKRFIVSKYMGLVISIDDAKKSLENKINRYKGMVDSEYLDDKQRKFYLKMIKDEELNLKNNKFDVYSSSDAKSDIAASLKSVIREVNIVRSYMEGLLKKIPYTGSRLVLEIVPTSDAVSDNIIESFDLQVGRNAGMSVFKHGSKYIIDDVLSAGDPLFSNSKEESDYFFLVKVIRNPNLKFKDIWVYTARPKKDRKLFSRGRTIPSNIFLSSSKSRVVGIGHDMGGRDVWKILVSEKYLISTLVSGRIRDYQAFNAGKPVPVKKIIGLNLESTICDLQLILADVELELTEY